MATAVDGRRSRSGYSSVAIALHWIIALMILGNVAGALIADGADKATAGMIMGIHKSMGLTVLVLSLVRLGWRVAHGFPALPATTSGVDAFFARTTHVLFYALMIAVPLAGWVMASGGSRPLEWFGLFDWPKLPVSEGTAELGHDLHGVLAFTTVGLVVLHVAGALKHHLIDRDDVLSRMLPLVRPRR